MAVKFGDTIKVHYTGTLADGEVFDTSREGEPLQFTIGNGDVIEAFDANIKGMEVGEKKTFTIDAVDAYGVYNEAFVQRIPRAQVPDDVKLEQGMPVLVGETEEDAVQFFVKELNDTEVVLDCNHPLAGEDLTFEVEVVEIVKKSPSVI